jgi:methionine aminopeptidase
MFYALAACRDLGVHIDGFIATEATTVVVQSDADAAVTGRAADVVQAAATALEAALRLMRPGRKISEVAEPLQKVGLGAAPVLLGVAELAPSS